MYRQPEVLVFDEATSELDVHTEERMFDVLETIARERTLLTVAHLLETFATADDVLVLEGGRAIDERRRAVSLPGTGRWLDKRSGRPCEVCRACHLRAVTSLDPEATRRLAMRAQAGRQLRVCHFLA